PGARRRPGLPRAGPGPAALGQHVRVRDRGRARLGRRLRRARPALAGPAAHRRLRARPRGPGDGRHRAVPLRRGRTAGRRPAVGVAGHPRHRRHPGLRHLPGQRHRQRPVPGAQQGRGEVGRGAGHRLRLAVAGVVRAGPAGAPHRRLRLPDLDLRGHRRGHLGGERLGPVLGLGPQGDLVVHRLGRLRRLPARPDDGRLARAPRGVGQRRGPGRDDLQPDLRQPGVQRPAQLRREV
ncbi:MAG: Cytochrome c-type biogenesis protein CcsA/ResC, partial [uncultured Blastococcus sp.]